MKRKIAVLLIAVTLFTSLLVGCGARSTNAALASTETSEIAVNATVAESVETETVEETKAPHEHAYTETVTTEATCETDGVKTFTCECGDTYDEVITATGHIFETYTSNNDATYLADGTETAKCNGCDVTDTRTAEGSMLTYTYTDMDATMYAQQTVNVRSMPSTDGEKLGGLSTNDEVKVTGQCAETSWYRIEYNGNVAYVSNNYLGADKVVVQAAAPAQSGSTSSTIANVFEAYDYAVAQGYPVYQAVNNGDGTATYYYLNINATVSQDEGTFMDSHYMAARESAVSLAGISGSFSETSGHYANIGNGWSLKWRTVHPK